MSYQLAEIKQTKPRNRHNKLISKHNLKTSGWKHAKGKQA